VQETVRSHVVASRIGRCARWLASELRKSSDDYKYRQIRERRRNAHRIGSSGALRYGATVSL